MANTDNPNGFQAVKTLSGSNPAIMTFPVAATQTLATGDMVYLSSGQVTIAASSSGVVLGVMAAPSVLATANTSVPVYVADSNTIFSGQCSGDSAIALLGTSVDIEGTTGIMEVNEDAVTELVVRIIGLDPNSSVGTNGRVHFIVARSQFNDYQDAE